MHLHFTLPKPIDHGFFENDNELTSIKKAAIKGGSITVLFRFANYGIQTISTIILARILEPESFGLIAMAVVVTGIIVEFGTLRLSEAIVQRKRINSSQASAIFWLSTALCCLLCLSLQAASPLISQVYNEPRLTPIVTTLALGFIFSGLASTHIAILNRKLMFLEASFIQLIAVAGSTLIAILFALSEKGTFALVARQLAVPGLSLIGAIYFCRWLPGKPSFDKETREMITFGLFSLGSYFTNYLTRSLDKFLIGLKFGSVSLGFYDRSYHLFVMPVNQLTYPLTNVAVSTLSKLIDNPSSFRQYYLNSLSLIAMAGMAMGAIATIIASDITIILLGESWAPAGEILKVMAPGIGFMLIYGTNGWLHLSLGKSDRYFRWNIIGLLATCILFFIGSSYGATGVAAAYSSSFVILAIPSLWYAGTPINLKFSDIIGATWRPTVAAAITVALKIYATPTILEFVYTWKDFLSILRVVILTSLSTFIYLTTLCLLHGSLHPIFRINGLIKQVFKR